MGQAISQSCTPPPLGLRDCLVNGTIDLAKYRLYSKRTHDDEDIFNEFKRKMIAENDDGPKRKKTTCYRSVKRHALLHHTDDGKVRDVNFKDSTWYCLYLRCPPEGERLNAMFRRRFRVPYSVFVELSNEIIQHDLFSRWTKKDCTGNDPTDHRLLLLGSLRHVGRALTFDDIEECTFVSNEVHRVFFLHFLEYGRTILHKKHVIEPARKLKLSSIGDIFKLAGLNGCIGSSDGTHIGMQQCPNWAAQNHKGFKLAIPSRNYNATVSHSHQILGTTFGHPGTFNDKTLVLYDELLRGVYEGKLFSEYEFTLYELDNDSCVVEVGHKGAWFIVDNGYLNWACTVPPIKNPLSYEEIRFSEWIESIRKDIECTFGILKRRFAVLKYGIRLGHVADCDKVWTTCCALHNMLLFYDKLDEGWESANAESIYNEKGSRTTRPFSINRLTKHRSEPKISKGENYSTNFFDKHTVNGKRVVQKMPLQVFQERLVHHFDIRFKNNDVKWPKRKARNGNSSN